ncbi:MAG: LacI family DNA-binding transcriptional regulator [Marinicaulis sp.]|nr:LacI family DNA-binding transcriptional regulator [Marinicaulis sp.]NNL90501.1 LacI family DNA-binding transcriptional regulator [Marinicaulis sp.]
MARRRQSVTIKHVAADAGVSIQTVSRVINDEPNVRPAMKERVQSSIDKLGYVPSTAARRMSGSRSYLILALNDRERTIEHWRAREGNDWVDQMLLGGMLKCAEHDYRLMLELVDTHDDHIERELSAALASLQPDGVILTPPHSNNEKIIKLLVAENIPFVRIGARKGGGGIPVSMDDERSACLATEHLQQFGHKRIGFIAGSSEYDLSRWRENGWRAAMKDLDLPTAGLLVKGDFSLASGKRAARELLNGASRATAIIASNDQMAFGVLAVAAEMEISVPQQLSLISFENSPGVRFCEPPLTAIDQPVAHTTAVAVGLIIDSLRGMPPPEERVVSPARLIARASVAQRAE